MNYKIFDTVIIPGITLIIIIAMAISLPARKKRNLAKWGRLLVPISGKKTKLFVPLAILIPLILAGIVIHDFGSGVNLIFAFTCVTAFNLMCQDIIASGRYGVYENALVTNGRVIPKDDFYALPTLQYENTEDFKKDKENDEYAKDGYEAAMKSLKIVTKNHGSVHVGFSNADERKAAVDVLKDWV